MIKVEKAEIELSETTVRALLRAIEEAKETIDFIDEPMPQGDMSTWQWDKSMRERGSVTVSSEYSDISYRISVEKRPNSQEGLGYRLDELAEPEKFSPCPEGFIHAVTEENN